MKSKILIFKALAAISAVGGAFASVSANSSLVLTSAYVRYTTAGTANIYCAGVGECNHPSINSCTALVQIGGQLVITTRARITILPNNNTCPTAIFGTHTSPAPINSAPLVLPPDAIIR